MGMTSRIREHVDADDAADQLRQYLSPGVFSGAAFETIGGRGDAPDTADRFTPADLVAVTTLSVRVSGWGAIDLLETRSDQFAELLAAVPHTPLSEASDEDLDPIWRLQDALDTVDRIGHVTRSKLLARKRPHLVPIRDQHVLIALTGKDHGRFTQPLRDALRHDGVLHRLEQLRDQAGTADLSLLRVLDIIVWMRTHGAASVSG
jgi:hypothetical protein